ncbi:unnamed protein product [Victoria cruziana]
MGKTVKKTARESDVGLNESNGREELKGPAASHLDSALQSDLNGGNAGPRDGSVLRTQRRTSSFKFQFEFPKACPLMTQVSAHVIKNFCMHHYSDGKILD